MEVWKTGGQKVLPFDRRFKDTFIYLSWSSNCEMCLPHLTSRVRGMMTSQWYWMVHIGLRLVLCADHHGVPTYTRPACHRVYDVLPRSHRTESTIQGWYVQAVHGKTSRYTWGKVVNSRHRVSKVYDSKSTAQMIFVVGNRLGVWPQWQCLVRLIIEYFLTRGTRGICQVLGVTMVVIDQ